MLLRYRYRIKLKRSDYLERTVTKVLKTKSAYKHYSTETQASLTKRKNVTVPAKHIIKVCPMIQQVFKMKEHLVQDLYTIKSKKQDQDDYIKIRKGSSLLNIKHYSLYVALIKLLQSKKFFLPSPLDSNPLELVHINIKFSELRKILKQSDGISFRNQVKEVLDSLSTVTISYRKNLNNEKMVIQGTSPLLGWYTPTYNKLKATNSDIKKAAGYLCIGINQLSWQVFERATLNYSLLNINVMFSLQSSLLRYLYCYLCSKVLPGFDKHIQFNVASLTKQIWMPTVNKRPMNLRNHRVRKACLQLYNMQEYLVDFEIKLKYSYTLEKSSKILEAIEVKRYKINITKENSAIPIKQVEKTQLMKEQKKHNLIATKQTTKRKVRKKRKQSKIYKNS